MDSHIGRALEVASEKLKGTNFMDFELLVDVSDMTYVWVSEEAARITGHTVPEMIGSAAFETNQLPDEELKAIIAELRKWMRYRMPLTAKGGARREVEMEFKPIYLGRERPYLVAKIVRGD